MKITIAGKEQELNFDMGFVHEINEKWNIDRNGMKMNMGAAHVFSAIEMGDIERLADIVYLSTYDNSPRCSHKDVIDYVGHLKIDEMEEFFDQVTKEINDSAPVKFAVKKMEKAAKEAQRKTKKTK